MNGEERRAPQECDRGEHQITPIPKLLAQLDLEGHLVTTDAMGAQISIAQTIIDKNADYLFALKGNQGATETEVRDHFDIALVKLI